MARDCPQRAGVRSRLSSSNEERHESGRPLVTVLEMKRNVTAVGGQGTNAQSKHIASCRWSRVVYRLLLVVGACARGNEEVLLFGGLWCLCFSGALAVVVRRIHWLR